MCLNQIYTTGAESNFGKVTSAEIDGKVEEVLDELDPDKALKLANEVDKLIWAEAVQPCRCSNQPETSPLRSDLANFGPAGLGDPELQRDRVHQVLSRPTS